MATEPWFLLFPAVGAVAFGVLGSRLIQRRDKLGGLGPDWGAAMGLGALAMACAVAVGTDVLTSQAEFALAFSAAGGAVALAAVLSALYERYSRGWIGSLTFRWVLYSAAVGLEGLGWGAILASPNPTTLSGTTIGPASPAAGNLWSIIPPAVASLPVVLFSALLARELMARAGPMNTVQLIMGAVLAALGFTWTASGDPLVGPAMAMTGAAFLYSAALALSAVSSSASARAVRPKVERQREEKVPKGSGVKVRVPKGGAQRVTSFRDGEPPGGGPV